MLGNNEQLAISSPLNRNRDHFNVMGSLIAREGHVKHGRRKSLLYNTTKDTTSQATNYTKLTVTLLAFKFQYENKIFELFNNSHLTFHAILFAILIIKYI